MLTIVKKTFIPSAFQQAIFDRVEDPNGGSLIVEAVAGSGKSTTIKQAVLRIVRAQQRRTFIQIFAFNSSIAREMKAAIAELAEAEGVDLSGVRVSTFHSVGFSAICKRLGKRADQVNTDSSKMRGVLRELFRQEGHDQGLRLDSALDDYSFQRWELYGSFCAKLVGLAKGNGFGAIVAAGIEDWRDLCGHHDLSLDSEEADEDRAIAYARAALARSNLAAQDGLIDFDDQLYLPLLWKLRLWENDWVFIDEAQDTNPVRRELAKRALRRGGRLVAVGDRRQAIYGFTGASHDAMDLIKAEFNCAELPLSVTYRCGTAIVALAQEIVPQITARDGAHAGSVATMTLKDALGRLESTDVIMCRNTAPLVELAFKLVAQGRGCRVLGKEIGAGLVNLIKKQRAKGIPNLMDKLQAWRDREVARHVAEDNEGKADAINDRFCCVRTIVDNLDENQRTVPGLCAKIETMFGDAGHDVLSLATMHKLKGLEFKRVALYRPELCPSKFAKHDWMLQQEMNLLYVGYTRAIDELMFVPGDL